MLKAQPTTKGNTNQTILRMSSAIEDAPYALDSARVLDARVVASCSGDGMNVPCLKAAASCGDID